MCYRGGRGVVPSAGVRPGKMIVKFRGWPRDSRPPRLAGIDTKKETSEIQKPLSGDRRSRTDDPLLAKQML